MKELMHTDSGRLPWMPDAVRWYRAPASVNANVHDGFSRPEARLTTDSLRSAAAGAAGD